MWDEIIINIGLTSVRIGNCIAGDLLLSELQFLSLEGCESGLSGSLGKRVCGKPYRGFESLLFRKLSFLHKKTVFSHFYPYFYDIIVLYL